MRIDPNRPIRTQRGDVVTLTSRVSSHGKYIYGRLGGGETIYTWDRRYGNLLYPTGLTGLGLAIENYVDGGDDFEGFKGFKVGTDYVLEMPADCVEPYRDAEVLCTDMDENKPILVRYRNPVGNAWYTTRLNPDGSGGGMQLLVKPVLHHRHLVLMRNGIVRNIETLKNHGVHDGIASILATFEEGVFAEGFPK